MVIRSAGSRFFASSLFAVALASAQLTTGIVEGQLHDRAGKPVANALMAITGNAGFHTDLHSDARGEFHIALPYGHYAITWNNTAAETFVPPLQTIHIDITEGHTAALTTEAAPGLFTIDPRDSPYPETFSFRALLDGLDPSSVTAPFDLTGIDDNRLGIESQRGESWTTTHYTLQGMDATDSYQPGHPVILPNVTAFDEIAVRENHVGFFLAEPESAWHFSLSSGDTGAPLASSNLPATGRGLLDQSEYFKWMTRDGAEIGGPIGTRAEIFASAWGQWASQTVPLAAPGKDQNSRLLFANVRGTVRITHRDRFESLYTGSRIDLSNFGSPAGFEAFAGNRMMPFFSLPGGVPGQPEVDHLDFVQAAWDHVFATRGTLQTRYGYSVAHLDSEISGQPGSIELTTGAITGAPPLGNFAIRTRQSFASAWNLAPLRIGWLRHQLIVGGDWNAAAPRNRFSAPSGGILLTANGAPAFTLVLNTPDADRESIRSGSLYAEDRIALAERLTLIAGLRAGINRGSTLIAWNNAAPHITLEADTPHSHGLILHAGYSRLYLPISGRDLDFGNPDSLSGKLYQWNGPLIARFGGAYSSISPNLRQPYVDRITTGAATSILRGLTAGIELFRADQKNRIAAEDIGVPASAYTPVTITDSGDNQPLTVYSQNPSTFGHDSYLLTNPPDLRFRNSGFVADLQGTWRHVIAEASFTAEKSYGPTNPGNAYFENDPGVIGSLFTDPNAGINSTNRDFTDRAYLGKLSAVWHTPWLHLDLSAVVTYSDGLPFARLLLVQGLAQGPVLVDATVRGSPEGGNRSEHLLNQNLSIRREFHLPIGRLSAWVEILNAANAAHKTIENDLTGPDFNQRLPLAIQPARSIRTGFTYTF